MNTSSSPGYIRRARSSSYLWRACAGAVIVFCMVLLTSVTALASSVRINDQLGVLNRSRVQSAAAALPYPVAIYSTSFAGSNSSFDQQAKSTFGGQSNGIVVAFNTHHVAILYGRDVPLSNSESNDAVNSFTSSYNGDRNYTNATVASLNSLQGSLQGSNAGASGARSSGGGSSFFGTFCLVGLIALALIALLTFMRRRTASRGFGGLGSGFGRNVPPGGSPNQFPPNYQGPYPPNYQGPYPPNYQPGQQGMNPWAAGGLGAAAGGFLGYELGKDAGERREERREGDYDNGGFGGGASGDFGGGDGGFGGGASGDFGGGDSGFGGGASGDFGGGDSGFGGGDSGFGGGGGNDNSGFGGGAGGDF